MAPPISDSTIRTFITAAVTFLLLIVWAGMVGGVFYLVTHKAQLDSILYGLLGTIFGTESTLLVAAISYWVGTTAGAKSSADAMAETNRTSGAALAQLAGAGPPPPAQPTGSPAAEPAKPPFMESPVR